MICCDYSQIIRIKFVGVAEFFVAKPNGVRYRYQSIGALAGDTSTSGPQYQMAHQNRWVLTAIQHRGRARRF
ncbi:hypothetical protein DPM13_01430 [Paracoccus mutanolyticus]|uniref:Uncharacterized protein n=1 Tax=Paracoccus mutanolyticus TaxID=1499308 RepID=A0ABM6WP04_9RHOB|nr:hypothetical protein DPM13_01430 [Paracoccus mutanolyticus]